MSPSRHTDPRLEANLVVRSLALRLLRGQRIDTHDHPWPQLVYASRGVLVVESPRGAWVVPPQRALWMAPGAPHAIESLGSLWLRTLYLHPRYRGLRQPDCSILHVSSFLRALVLEIVQRGFLDRRQRPEARLAGVLVDTLRGAPEIAADLPLPQDPRARRMADQIRADPADMRPLQALATDSGASVRTLERLFQRETSMSLGRWRRQARLTHALGLLADGEPVTGVALAVGYDSPSAFIALFKKTFGRTPGQMFRKPESSERASSRGSGRPGQGL